MKAMNDISTIDLTDEMDLSYDVSDEVLLLAARRVLLSDRSELHHPPRESCRIRE
jgi:hypothetical protein